MSRRLSGASELKVSSLLRPPPSGSDVSQRGNQPGEIGLLLELFLHLATDLSGRVVDFADFGEEGGDLVTAEESSRPSLQQVTQAGLDGSWGGRENSKKSFNISQSDKKTTIRSGPAAEHKCEGGKKQKLTEP